jgi:hypothetical protein
MVLPQPSQIPIPLNNFVPEIYRDHLLSEKSDPDISLPEILEFASYVWELASATSSSGVWPRYMMTLLSRVIRGDPRSMLSHGDVNEGGS